MITERRFSAKGRAEKIATMSLLKPGAEHDTPSAAATQKELSFAEQALKKRKLNEDSTKYIDMRFLSPNTIIVERLFPKLDTLLVSTESMWIPTI